MSGILPLLNEEAGYKKGRNSPFFCDFRASVKMAELVVFLLALYRTFSGLPVPFCIDLAVSKCLEQNSIQK